MTRSGPIFAPRILCLIVSGAAVVTLAACSNKEPDLMRFRNVTDQPDEFTLVPARPLVTPENTAALPVPTPGSPNRADQTPVNDAIVALGGTQSTNGSGTIPSADSALISYADRYGIDPDIRAQLAEEDLALRQRRLPRPLERIGNVNVYYRTYESYQLDQQAEIDRLRAQGVRVPTAPPKELKPR